MKATSENHVEEKLRQVSDMFNSMAGTVQPLLEKTRSKIDGLLFIPVKKAIDEGVITKQEAELVIGEFTKAIEDIKQAEKEITAMVAAKEQIVQ